MSSVTYSRLLSPITFYVFLPLSILIFAAHDQITGASLDPAVLMGGNIILYIITAGALYFHRKGSLDKNPNAFFRTVYASMILRMFLCIVAVIVYAMAAGNTINKYSLLLCFLFYFMYSFVEVRRIMLLLKKQE
jgi:hypothetical protein